MTRIAVRLAVLFLVACSSSTSSPSDGGAADAARPPCGQPGDQANSKGVGQYCPQTSDCPVQAPLCSSLGDVTTHFCTFRCMAADAGVPDGATPLPTDCGEGAACVCDKAGVNCGCTPTHCL